MQNIFFDTRVLDKKAREAFNLSEELMMENAAYGLEQAVVPHIFSESGRYINRPTVLILAGNGNNGADGYALARRLINHEVSVVVCELGNPKSDIAKIQKERAKKIGVHFFNLYELDNFIEEKSFDISVVVDCLYGSGFHLPLDYESESIIQSANKIDAYKISCDVPSGLDSLGNGKTIFCANETICMGSLKFSLFSDYAKDFCGTIKVCNLGISKTNFEQSILPDGLLLEESELKLPTRKLNNVHKGTFGHVAIACGEKIGASQIASLAAFNFGAGLVTLVGAENSFDISIMASLEFPQKTNSILIGPGLGRENKNANKYFDFLNANKSLPCVFDADIFYYKEINSLIAERQNLVLTPHPKEAASLLELCGFGSFSVDQVIQNKLELAKKFCQKFKNVVLLLKGSVVIIARWSKEEKRTQIFVNPYGSPSLAKGGSGDVLAGLISSLLAQNYDAMNATVSASLAHSFASNKIKNNFSLNPKMLIEKIMEL